jgi:chemotaxis protein MotB
MKKITLTLTMLAIVVGMSACVARKKYDAEASAKAASEEKARKLGKELAAANARLADYERSMSEMDAKNKNQEAILKKRAEDLDSREKAIADLRARLAARDKALNDLRDKLRSALIQFPAADLSIEMRDGKVYIAISDKMLFKSGSDKVEPLGKDALHQVATVMKAYPEMDLIIEGHTDNVPIKSVRYADNWDLSVKRATSVVRVLTKEYGLPVTQVTPSGKGEFFPKATNETAEGRSKNRRTEIIIAPKLEEIQNLVIK